MNAVTCLTWVRRGVAKRRPDKVKLTDDDLSQLVKNFQETNFSEDPEESEDTSDVVVDGTRKRKLAQDEVLDHEEDASDEDDETGEAPTNPLSLGGVAVFSDNNKDPYMQNYADSDEEQDEILPSENLVVVGKMKRDFCNLEVYVYNEQLGSSWCHHELILPNIPICMDVINHDLADGSSGNFIALGTMGPDIEIWDLDVMESLEPAFVLRGKSKEKEGKTKKKKKTHLGHTDAVLGIAWNRHLPHVLASASADGTLGLWDLDKAELSTSVAHGDKVQAVQWHASRPSVLLTGCADHTVNMFDCKSLEPSQTSWEVNGEVESVLWNIHNDNQCFACTDTGYVYLLDVRKSKPLLHIQAHAKDVTGMAMSSSIEGCLLTTSADGSIKVWDVRGSQPRYVSKKELPLGQLFCCASSPDVGHVFAVGGECELKIMNLKKFSGVVKYFEMTDAAQEDFTEEFEQINSDDDPDENSDLSDVETLQVNSKNKKKKKKKQQVNENLEEASEMKLETSENGATGHESRPIAKPKKRNRKKKSTFQVESNNDASMN